MKRCWLALVAVLALGACVQTWNTNLALAPPGQRLKVSGADRVGVKVSVADGRLDKTHIGTGTGAGNSGATWLLVSRQPIEEVTAKGVEAEMVARGFRLGDGPAFLLVDIQHADCLGETGGAMGPVALSAEVVLAAQVLDASGRVLHANTYRASDQRRGNMFKGFAGAPVVLQEVIARAIRDMGDDDRLQQALYEAGGRG